MVRRYKETHSSFDEFPEKVAFQLNDTHPTIGVAELMRLLMDENRLGWTQAWDMTCKVRHKCLHDAPRTSHAPVLANRPLALGCHTTGQKQPADE